MDVPIVPRHIPHDLWDELIDAGFDDAAEIGQGGFGVVARCHQRALDRMVAVKILTGPLSDDDIERFFREQRAMGRLSGHPNVVDVFGVGTTTTGRPYLVMPYHSAGSLDLQIRRDGPISWTEAMRLGIKIAGSLESAHRIGIVHRDVKPANILLSAYGDPQLSDFGIARVAGVFETSDGRVTGSPAFSAPEILRGAQPTPESDVYGLGATLFTAITGHAPFERQIGQSLVTQFLRIASGDLVIEHDIRIPRDLYACIEKAMSRDPNERYSSAMNFGNELRALEARHQCSIDEMIYPHDSRDVNTRQVHARATTVDAAASPDNSLDAPYPPLNIEFPKEGEPPRSGNLPSDITTFIGRRKEVTFIKKRLSTSRLVTLTGIGGVGKTRLALHVGANVRRAFPDGVWLVELGEVEDSEFVGSTVSRSLGLRNEMAMSQTSILVAYLADKQLLLILDNCEHHLTPVSQLAQSILRRCPDVRILATSRAPLGMTGETTVTVPSMSLPDAGTAAGVVNAQLSEAMTLFQDRASAVSPNFDRDSTNEHVAEICRRVDGLPLAIELAAVRLRSLSTRQILDRLSDQYQLLTAGSRVAPRRQQTLRLCIDWSYDLCTALEQQMWARISVFSAGFELDAAEAICAGDLSAGDFLNVITSLVDMSILVREERDSSVRYRLLDTLRDYGKQKLKERDEYLTMRETHRLWYEQLVANAEIEWFSTHQIAMITRLEHERPNLREALQFGIELIERDCSEHFAADSEEGPLLMAVRLFPFWLSRGHLSEGRTWLDRVLTATRKQPPSTARLRLCYVATAMAGFQGDTEAGRALLEEASTLRAQIGDSSLRELAEWAAGCVALYADDIDTALECFERVILDVSSAQLTFAQTSSVLGLGLAHLIKRQASEALRDYELMLDLTSGYREHIHLGRCSSVGGWALWNLGHPDQAISVLSDGLERARAVDDPVASARCVHVLAWIEADLHHDERAATLLGAADMLWRDVVGAMPDFLRQLPYQNECEQRTQKTLGKRGFTTCFKHGHQMSFDQVVSYVFGRSTSSSATTRDEPRTSLTKREQQVAALVANGLSNNEIAAKLVIAPRTAQGHVENILIKLGFHSRTQIAVWHAALSDSDS